MIVTYFRSSLLGGIKFCEQKAFIEYNLGYQDSANQKAEAGTITHKVLEVLAACKKALQDGKSFIEDDALGHIDFEEKDLYKEYKLPSNFIDAINKHRSYKSKYKWDCTIPNGHIRYGYDFTQEILKQSYDYYTSHSEFEWKKSNFYDCENWVWIPLECTNQAYDPRLRQIYAPEQKFDFELEEDWAHYEYKLFGEKIEGQLRLKGTIDLIAHLGDNQLEVVDWKGLALETKIPTINGWKTMASIQIGDIAFDEFGQTTKVIGKSKIKYLHSYEVIFDDNTTVICDHEHLWSLYDHQVLNVLELKPGDIIRIPQVLNCNNSDIYKSFLKNAPHKLNQNAKTRSIKNVIYIGMKKTQCIMVDSPTNTYLCTENFIPTHNTGQRKCWATGKEKTYEVLQQDPQLMFYFLALDKLLPDKHAVMTIYFIRDGGPFSLYFDDETRDKMYDILKDTFKELIENEKPKLIAPSYKCSWCSFYKNKFADEKDAKNICTTIKDSIESQGMQKTIEEYKNPDFIIGSYHDPGSV